MKPARKSVSSRLKLCASVKKPHESCPFVTPCGSRRKKMTVIRHQLFLRNFPVHAFDSRAQGLTVQAYRVRRSTNRYGLLHWDQSRRDMWRGVITPHY